MKMHTQQILSFIMFLFVLMSCDKTENPIVEVPDGLSGASTVDTVDTVEISDSIRFPDFLVEYLPAPGQFINVNPGRPQEAQSIIGGIGFVTLGGWGGYIIIGFNEPIINRTENQYGVDFSIFGNAYEGSSEPGIVMVMKDENKNGKADDTWYELKGNEYDNNSTTTDYTLTYYHINDTLITWKDNQGNNDTILHNSYHKQSYYPSTEFFTNANQDSLTFSGTLLEKKSYPDNTGQWVNPTFGYGYADNHSVDWKKPLNEPDDPETETIEGAGGDAFKLEWAINTEGEPVKIDTVHFIKIYNGIRHINPVIGEVSTEIKAIVAIQ